MQRVLIIGVAGAGKTTLARELGEITGLPVVHLDELYWQPGWVQPPADGWQATVAELAGRERWIMDGNYGRTLDVRLAAADMVVFMDPPTWRALAGVVRRSLAYRGRVRPGMAPGCGERLNREFLHWILTYRRRRRPETLRKLKNLPPSVEVVVLRSRRDAAAFVERMRVRQRGGPGA